MTDVLINSAPIFLTVILILIYRWKKEVPEQLSNVAAFLAFKVVVPFLIFQILRDVQIGRQDIGFMLLGVATLPVLLLVMYLFTKITKPKRPKKASMMISSVDFYTYGFGLPFILLNFGSDVITRYLLIDLAIFIVYMILGFAIADYYSSDGSDGIKNLLKKAILINPIFWTFVIVIALNQLEVKLPDRFYDITGFFSSAFPFLTAAMIGANIALPNMRNIKLLLGNSLLRLITGFLIATLVTQLFNMNSANSIAFYLFFLLPISPFGLIFTQQNGNDSKYFAQVQVFSYTMMLLLYPVIIGILKNIF